MNDEIELSRDDAGVATIRLNRPGALNALSGAMFSRLEQLFGEVAAEPRDRVLIVTGSGSAFCSGADLRDNPEAAASLGQGPVARAEWIRTTTAAALALHRLPKPTIAAVNGVAAGAGCNLALGCDIGFAAESARFVEVFVNRGLSLDYGGTWLLPRLVGLQRAKDIAFRGEAIDAQEALRLGLVLEVVPDAELLPRATEYARMLAGKPPIALSLIKGGLDRAFAWTFEEGLEYENQAQAICMGSSDFREAMVAWMQKREGSYHGK